MSNIGIIIFARMKSKRLYGKVLKRIGKKTLLEIIIKRLKKVSNKFPIIVATSLDPSDNRIKSFCQKKKILCFRGSLQDVYKRANDCCKKYNLKAFVRICGDRPFVDFELVKKMLFFYKSNLNKFDILTNVFPRSYPKGLTCELISCNIFNEKIRKKLKKKEKEHIINFFYKNNSNYKIKNFKSKIKWNKKIKLSLDTQKDFEKVKKIYGFYNNNYLIKSSKVKKYFLNK